MLYLNRLVMQRIVYMGHFT